MHKGILVSRLACIALAAVAVLISASAASAQVTINLSTGLDGSGNVQGSTLFPNPPNADANWTVTGAPDPISLPTAYVVEPGNSDWCDCWVPNSSTSDWIAANPYDAGGNGFMTFTRTFTLGAGQVAPASITGSWTIDDGGTLTLNGNLIDTRVDGNWTSLHPVSVAAGSGDFVAGINTLVMTVTDTDFFLEGARFDGTLTTIPEPASGLAMLAGIALVGVARRRGRATSKG